MIRWSIWSTTSSFLTPSLANTNSIQSRELVAGTLARRPRAKVVLVPEGAENEDGADEIYIADENMNHAMVGDTVRIRKFNYKSRWTGCRTGGVC